MLARATHSDNIRRYLKAFTSDPRAHDEIEAASLDELEARIRTIDLARLSAWGGRVAVAKALADAALSQGDTGRPESERADSVTKRAALHAAFEGLASGRANRLDLT